MKVASLLLSIALAAAPAAAQPVTHPDGTSSELSVEVLAPDGDVDPAAVREAIANELAIGVTDGSSFAPSRGRLEVAVGAGVIRIAYHPAAGTVIERTLAMPIAMEERIELIAYIATNLVRDQAGEVMSDLPVIVPPPPRVMPPRPVAAPSRFLPFTIGFVPPLSLDRAFGERVVVGVGVHAIAGMTTASELASVSGVADVQREYARGVQVGGVVAVAGRLDGALQIGGVVAVSRGQVDGVQLAGVASAARGDVDGAQIAGVAALSRGHVDGFQLGGVATAARSVDGVQVGGVINVAGRVDGAQLAGLANVGGDVDGVQIGVVNVARKMRGVQLGVVNVSDDGDESIPIGIINYARNGQLGAEAWADTNRLSAVAVRHGTKYVHNLWGVAWSPDHDHVLVGAGLGAHLPLAGTRAGFDIDAMAWATDVWDGDTGQLSQLRASVAIPFGNVEVFGGAAANLYVTDEMDESASFHPVAERRTTTDGGTTIVGWPSVFAGVRLKAR